MLHLIWMCIIGLVAGAFAKWIMPGKNPGGIIITMLLGIAGSLLAGFGGRMYACEGWSAIGRTPMARGFGIIDAMPHRTRHVALIYDARTVYGVKVMTGVAAYLQEGADWTVYIEEHALKDQRLPDLRSWRGDGIIANFDDPRVATAAMSSGVPTVAYGSDYGWFQFMPPAPYFVLCQPATGARWRRSKSTARSTPYWIAAARRLQPPAPMTSAASRVTCGSTVHLGAVHQQPQCGRPAQRHFRAAGGLPTRPETGQPVAQGREVRRSRVRELRIPTTCISG